MSQSRSYRRTQTLLMILIAVALLSALPAGAATEVYLIQASNLVGLPADCGGGSFHNGCDNSRQPGFEFSDSLPDGSSVLSIQVEFNHGVQCAPDDFVFEADFNGSVVGTFSSPRHCTCGPRVATHSFSVDPASYQVGGLNSFVIRNPNSCQGLLPATSLGAAYARVTVEFEDGGGSGGGGPGEGGGCDVEPVLVAIAEAHEGTRNRVGSEAAATREQVVAEADRLAGLLDAQEDRLRELVQDQVLRHLLEQDLADPSASMPARACLPADAGGNLPLTMTIVLETMDAFSLAGCDISVSERLLENGDREMMRDDFLKACDWYRKAYQSAGHSCP